MVSVQGWLYSWHGEGTPLSLSLTQSSKCVLSADREALVLQGHRLLAL